jgi:hypothetical protein
VLFFKKDDTVTQKSVIVKSTINIQQQGATMARISFFKNYKSKDYYFFDRIVKEQFEVASTGIFVHKYTGPVMEDGTANPDVIGELQIQDLLLLENRDRTYDPDVYELKGHYQLGDHDFDLGQFGLFLQSDTIYVTFHINDMMERLGRRLMSGDVLEMQHLRDDSGLDQNKAPSRKFYVVQDASKSADGYSPTWYPHIWRVKCTPLEDSQEYKQIMEQVEDDGTTLRDNQSVLAQTLNIMDAIVAAAEETAPLTTYDVHHLANFEADTPLVSHGTPIPEGNSFPPTPRQGDKFIRSDFKPSRSFEFRDRRWHRLYDNVSGTSWIDRTVNGATYVDNPNTTIVGGREFSERQALSKVIKPKTDN